MESSLSILSKRKFNLITENIGNKQYPNKKTSNPVKIPIPTQTEYKQIVKVQASNIKVTSISGEQFGKYGKEEESGEVGKEEESGEAGKEEESGEAGKEEEPEELLDDSSEEFENKSTYKTLSKIKPNFTDEELLNHYRKNPPIKKYMRDCRYSGCTKQASFGPITGGWYRCKTHKLSTDKNNRARKCETDGCKLQASFGPQESKKVFRCKKHKLPGDINKTNSICSYPGCKKTASFGLDGGKKLTCYDHKLSNYVNIKKPS